MPGIASATTVMANHCREFIVSPYARTGILKNNPIHKDMLYAAQQAGLAFILNVVINAEKKVIAAFAGDSEKAHLTGCEYVLKMAEVKAQPADIVVTTNGGYPLDQNIYQSVKGMTAAEANCKKDGVIIMVTDMCSPEMIKEMHMEHAYTFEDALQRAFELKGKDAGVVVIPDGVSVIVRP